MSALPSTRKRLASLMYLARPLLLLFVGIVLLSLGVAYLFIELYRTAQLPPIFYYLTLQFLGQGLRAALFLLLGLLVVASGLWRLSGLVIFPVDARPSDSERLVLGYRREGELPRMVAISGGAGLLILAGLGERLHQLTCIIPPQDAVEYYYRASSLFSFRNVYYIVPTPVPLNALARLSNGDLVPMHAQSVVHNERLAKEHVEQLVLTVAQDDGRVPATLPVARMALDALREADVIVLGPGGLFESVVPTLMLTDVQAAIRDSRARVLYVCNLMTEPGLTTGFDVADHIRVIKHYGGFTPDYVLVNAQRIDPDVRQMYEAANYAPVYLDPEAYEETAVVAGEQGRQKQLVVEGAVVIEADLASAMVQLTASLDDPGQSRAVRVLRHDPEKLRAAIMAVLQRG
jgi:hypothetical protein